MNRDQRIQDGPLTQEAYEIIVDELADLRRRKVMSYGESRYHEQDLTRAMNLVESDINRKYIRIQHAVAQGRFDQEDGESLREALMDLANYALMGVQIMDQQVENLKIDQLVFTTDHPQEAMKDLAALLGREVKWAHDIASATGEVFGEEDCSNKVDLYFSEEVAGIRFGYLNYLEGERWLTEYEDNQLSHLGIHVQDIEAWKKHILDLGYEIAMETETFEHTNPALNGRRYHYVIVDSRERLGFDLKIIQRIG